jgi:hypothetical protein
MIRSSRILFKVKRFYAKLRIERNRKIINSFEMNEKKAVRIFMAMLRDSNSSFRIAPFTREKIIENRDRVMFINLADDRVTIINSVYQYDIKIAPRTSELLNNKFNEASQRRAIQVKSQWNNKVSQSLDSIIKEIEVIK